MKLFLFSFSVFLSLTVQSQKGTVLFFVAQDSAYYSEYVVFHEALIASGYAVDVRSATSSNVSTYMIPHGTTIDATANSLSGSSAAQFDQDFLAQFGSSWNASLNAIPTSIAVQGRIQDVSSMNNYVGLVLAGGTGIQQYRVDGNYEANGAASAVEVQAAAEKLNTLAIEALQQGKPVLGQCHGASIPAFWRIPGTAGAGAESLGYSILKGQNATGFPESATGNTLTSLDIQYRSSAVAVIASPHSSLNASSANSKIITSRDWYPQSVAHAAKTFINILETFPSAVQITQSMNVLLIHGGPLDTNNCSASNKNNDVPCNYGTGPNLPADYTSVQTLLSASLNDGFQFNVSDLNLAGSLPFTASDVSSVESYLSNYDAVVFFKHWSTHLTDQIQQALKNFADGGKGIVSIHHGLYNDVSGANNKDILVNEVFGVSSEMATWSAQIGNVALYNTNYGHFISSYLVNFPLSGNQPATWNSNPNLSSGNLSRSTLPYFTFDEETYNNTSFTGSPVFGNQDNQITTLFSNDISPASQAHTAGFCKLYNPSLDASTGRVVCLMPGERTESYSIFSTYGQIIRNALVWAANKAPMITATHKHPDLSTWVYPNPVEDVLHFSSNNYHVATLYDLSGKAIVQLLAGTQSINLSAFPSGIYVLVIQSDEGKQTLKVVKN